MDFFLWPLKEFNEPKDRLAYWLPWYFLGDDGVMVNKDGSLQTTFAFRGPDLASATSLELKNLSAQINSAIMRLGTGWCFYSDVVRHISDTYKTSHTDSIMAQTIDMERKKHFLKGIHYENDYYFTLVYLPPPAAQSKLLSLMVESNVNDNVFEETITIFKSEATKLFETLSMYLPETRGLSNEEIISYYHNCVSERRMNVKLPEEYIFFDAYLADSPLMGGFRPKLGSKHLRTVSVLHYPGSSIPGVLDALNRLGFEYRWTSRFILLDKTDARAVLSGITKRWKQDAKNLQTYIKEIATKQESGEVNEDSMYRMEESKTAAFLLETDEVGFGYYTFVVTILDEDEAMADKKAAEVLKVINGLGFTGIIETLQAVEAFFSTIPGMCRANIRRDLCATVNMVHFFPLSAPWAGPQKNKHLNGPPLLYAETFGSTPFRLDLHGETRDIGHTMVIGPTGAGKSAFLNLLETSFLKYKNSQIFIFDKGMSAKVPTYASSGQFYNLGMEEEGSLSLQPLANIDDLNERAWAKEWLINYLESVKFPVVPEVANLIETALNELATQEKQHRTLTGFYYQIQNNEVKEAITPLTSFGSYGRLFDADRDGFSNARWQCFEMETLMHTPSVVMPVLDYLFHKIEGRLNGDPTLIVLDECWVFLDHPVFVGKIREWLKTLRKANASVVFATQSMSDVVTSSIAPVIRESCPTKILLPNGSAEEKSNAEFYRSFGLNDQEIHLISTGVPKQDYYYKSPEGSRYFQLALGETALAYVASTSKEDTIAAERIYKALTNMDAQQREEEFNRLWLEYKIY